MAEYVWEGKTRQGETRSGVMEAPSKEAVNNRLAAQQIQPSRVRRKSALDINITFGSGVKTKEIVIFVRQFATMIDSGLPLVQCLEILGNQQDNKAFQKVIQAVKNDVESGSTLADALGRHPKIFDELFVNLVAAGEVGGILDTILNRLATYMEQNMKLIGQVKAAMVYPGVVVTVAIGVTLVLLIFVIPMFEKMFADFGSTLPAPTQFVLDLSEALQNYGLYVFLAAVAVIFAYKTAMKTDRGQLIKDQLFMKAPVFGPLLRKVAVAKFTRTLGTMVSSGVSILEAMQITAKSAGNRVVENAILHVRDCVSEGQQMADPLAETKVFPAMVVQMIAVGESTGALDAMLQKIADFYDEEVEAAVDALTSLLEPLMMVVLGGLLGGLIVAMYLPIFDMAGAIQ